MLITGTLLKKTGMVSEEYIKNSNSLVFNLFLPVLLFYKISQSDFLEVFSSTSILIMFMVIIVVALFSFVLGWLLHFSRRTIGTFTSSNFRANYAFLGLPICYYAFGDQGLEIASLFMAFVLPMVNILSVFSFSINHSKKLMPVKIIKDTLISPLVISCIAGIIVVLNGWQLPVFIDRTFSILSSVTLPLALLGIGATIHIKGLSGNKIILILSNVIKLLVMPSIAYLLLSVLGIEVGLTEKVLIVLLACPSATVNYILASSLNGDSELASEIIVTTTICSLFSIIVWLNFLGV